MKRIKSEDNSELGLFEYFYNGNLNQLISIKKDEKSYKYFSYLDNRLSSINGRSVIYDQSGNTIKYKDFDTIYDARRLITKYRGNSLEYNHTGVRISKYS